MRKFSTILMTIFIISSTLIAQQGFNCFSIIAGKDCTVDGSVLFGHNEDDSGDQIVNMYKVPRLQHSTKKQITLKNGGKCQQVLETNGYIWLEMPGMKFSDAYLNEHNVVIASDNCPSKEDSPEITDGGIGYWLRRLMAESGETSREAVEIGGQLVEKFGYTASGRSYCIADPNEAWVMSVIQGKHWVAQRIPDNEVMIIPNYYTIQEINLKDSVNYLGSKDLIEYAISRGWYNPNNDGIFNFHEVYGKEKVLKSPGNINRQWGGLRLIAKEQFEIDDNFPFTIKPKKKLDLADIFAVLRDHYEKTELKNIDHSNSPHKNINRPICTLSTQYGFVAQLRSDLPKEIAGIMWYSPVQPCLHPFIPIYINTTEFPKSFAHEDYKTGLKLHFDENYSEIKENFTNHSFQTFTNFSQWVNKDYYTRSSKVIKDYNNFELKNYQNQVQFDQKLQQEFKINPQNAMKILTNYSNDNLEMLLKLQIYQK